VVLMHEQSRSRDQDQPGGPQAAQPGPGRALPEGEQDQGAIGHVQRGHQIVRVVHAEQDLKDPGQQWIGGELAGEAESSRQEQKTQP